MNQNKNDSFCVHKKKINRFLSFLFTPPDRYTNILVIGMCAMLSNLASWEYLCSDRNIRAQLHGSPNHKFCSYEHHSPLAWQVPNFCASCVSVECLATWSTHAHKPTFLANTLNMHDVTTEFPASTRADSSLLVKQSHEIGPRAWVRYDMATDLGPFWVLQHYTSD